MSKKFFAGLLLLACVWIVGCKKDEEIAPVLKEFDAFTAELVQKVEAAQGSIAGIDAAQQFLDAKKGDIKKRLELLKDVRGFQVSDEMKKTMTDSFVKNATAVASLQIKYVGLSVRDPNHKARLEKLLSDYKSLLPT